MHGAYVCACVCVRERGCERERKREREREEGGEKVQRREGRRDVKFSNEFMRIRIDTIVILFSSGGKKNTQHLM